MEAADREGWQRVGALSYQPSWQTYLEICCEIFHACSKPATWKGSHWCECCPCTCKLIKSLIMTWLYDINIIKMWHLTACKYSISLNWIKKWNDFFYCISDLMLVTLIQNTIKNHFIFDPVQKTNWSFIGCQVLHWMNVLIFFKPFLDNKMSIFEEYGAFKFAICSLHVSPLFIQMSIISNQKFWALGV